MARRRIHASRMGIVIEMVGCKREAEQEFQVTVRDRSKMSARDRSGFDLPVLRE